MKPEGGCQKNRASHRIQQMSLSVASIGLQFFFDEKIHKAGFHPVLLLSFIASKGAISGLRKGH